MSTTRGNIHSTGLLARRARVAVRRRVFILAAWLVALAALFALSRFVGGSFAGSLTIPGTESG